MNYAQSDEIRSRGFLGGLRERLVYGNESVGGTVKGAVSDSFVAGATRIKRAFDPLNMVRLATGNSQMAVALAGRMFGRKRSDIQYFSGQKPDTEVTQLSQSMEVVNAGLTKVSKMLAIQNAYDMQKMKRRQKEYAEEEAYEDKLHGDIMEIFLDSIGSRDIAKKELRRLNLKKLKKFSGFFAVAGLAALAGILVLPKLIFKQEKDTEKEIDESTGILPDLSIFGESFGEKLSELSKGFEFKEITELLQSMEDSLKETFGMKEPAEEAPQSGDEIRTMREAKPQPIKEGKTRKFDVSGGLRAFAGAVEGSKGYETIYGGKTAPLTKMTLPEVLRFQKEEMVGKGMKSSAVGLYQMISKNVSSYIDKLKKEGVDPNKVVFDEKTQDAMAQWLISQKSTLSKWLDGKLPLEKIDDALTNFAQIWAAAPVSQTITNNAGRTVQPGQSYYAGDGLNKALISVDDAKNLLLRMRQERTGESLTMIPSNDGRTSALIEASEQNKQQLEEMERKKKIGHTVMIDGSKNTTVIQPTTETVSPINPDVNPILDQRTK